MNKDNLSSWTKHARTFISELTSRVHTKGNGESKSGVWINPSKRGGMDGAFRGLAGLLRGIGSLNFTK